jgi:hypothetical protein
VNPGTGIEAIADDAVVTFVAGTPDAVQTAASVPAAGTAGTATAIVITVRDGNDNPVVGQAANLAVDVTGANTVTAPQPTDNGDGTYTTSYTPTTVGTDNVAITLDGTPISGSPYASVVSAGAAAQYLVTPSSSAPSAGSDITITAQLADANGNPVAISGRDVGWSSTNGGTFSAASTATDTDGIAIVTFTTSITPGTTHTVTGDDGTVSGSSSTITTQ